MKTKNRTVLRRVSINLPIILINRVKEYAGIIGVNYTTAYIILLNQSLQNMEIKK